MKHIALFFALILTSATILSAQDTIPNPGFENWGNNPNYEKPDGWTTLNALTYLLGKITAYKTSAPGEVHSGNHAIKLVSKFITTSDFGPAVVTTGSINPQGVFGGNPINSRPDAITGWYKYAPLGNDQALFEINLYKQGVVIGSGTFNQTDSVNEWTNFSVAITYSSTEVPDAIQINFFASQGGDSPPAEENSTLYIDDVAYDFSSGFRDLASGDAIKILPNPASEKITIEIQNMDIKSFIIYSLDGKKVKEVILKNNEREIQVDDLMPGKYILTANPKSGKTLTGLFGIQR